MKHKYIAYLHSCGLSHGELTDIFSVETCAREFYEGLNHSRLQKYVKNVSRRDKILENYAKLKTTYIDTILEKLGVNIITLNDDSYPEKLKNIPHTPFILYVRGKIPDVDMFAVVGSRKITPYGEKVIKHILPEISNTFPIVSGGAAGCDTLAHKSCIDSGNKTVVVVGTGIDETYPVSNENLFNRVAEGYGAIVSIFRIGEPGNPYNFPVRNEIVVGLSSGVLVIEAKEKSGSLITAGLALDLGKDLFSVPGDILSPYYRGTNKLIKNGEAKCVRESLDILEEYNVTVKLQQHKQKLEFGDETEKRIYESLTQNCQNIDELSSGLQIPAQILLSKVSLLELKGVLKKDLRGKYELV